MSNIDQLRKQYENLSAAAKETYGSKPPKPENTFSEKLQGAIDEWNNTHGSNTGSMHLGLDYGNNNDYNYDYGGNDNDNDYGNNDDD